MIAIAITTTYVLVALASWRPIFRGMFAALDSEYPTYTDWPDVVASAVGATLAVTFWPFTWIVIGMNRKWTPSEFGRLVAGESRSARREREIRLQREAIARLERELEIERRGGTTS